MASPWSEVHELLEEQAGRDGGGLTEPEVNHTLAPLDAGA